MKTKDRVRRYAANHPEATIRDIQKALDISSPSVVHYHLGSRTKDDRIAELEQQLREARSGR